MITTTKEIPKYYCYTCGTLCETMPITMSYNTETGEPNIAYIHSCPKSKWYAFWHPEHFSD